MSWTGPGPLTSSSALGAWRWDVPALLVVLVAAVAYLAGVRSVRRAGGRWPVIRTVSFLAGLVLAALATCWFVGVYARVLFWVFTLQVCLLLLVVPPLLGLGSPVALAARTLPPGPRRTFAALGRSPVVRALRLPGVGPFLLIVVTMVVFFTPVLQACLEHAFAYHLLHLSLVVVGVAMVLPMTDEEVMYTSSTAYAAMFGLAFVEFLADAIPGLLLRLRGTLVAAGYWTTLGRPWGPSPMTDQHHAGALLWFFGEAGDLPFLLVILVAWIRADARDAARIDRELDLAELSSAAPVSGGHPAPRGSSAAAAEPEPQLQRPWWQTDASVFGEDRARRYGWTPPPPDAAEASSTDEQENR